jgi:hypothetical protein
LNYAFSNDYYVPDHYWHFVPDRHFGNEHAENHYVGLVGFANIFRRSQIIKNLANDEHGRPIYNKGPDKISVELHTKRTFRELAIKTMDKAGQQVKKEEVSLFMPPIKKEIVETERSAPARVMQWKSDEPLQQKKEAPRQITPAPVIKHDEQPRIISSPVITNDERRQMSIPETKKEVQQPITPAPVVAPPRVNNDQKKIERSEERFPAQAPVQHAPINQPVIIERPRSIPPSYVPPKTNPTIQPRSFEPVERARPNIQRPEKSAPIKQAPPIKQTAPRKQSERDIRNDG